jgi:glycolate oxidase iron-sulfur subunit
MLLYGLYQGQLKPTPALNDRLFSCTLCGICESSCPTGVNITEAIYYGRNHLRSSDRQRRYLRAVAKFSVKRPLLSFRAVKLLRPFLLYLHKKGTLPFEIQLPEEPLKNEQWIFKPKKTRGRVALFTGCSVNFLFPRLGELLIKVLLRAGYEVVLPPGEVCCGAPLRTLGLEQETAELARKNIEVFGKLHTEAVLSLCPTCTLTIKKHYPRLIGQGLENTMDISEFLLDKLAVPAVTHYKNVIYHDPCHLYYGLGIKEQPREILRQLGIKGIEPEEAGCCGFSLSLSHKEISSGLLKNLNEYQKADTLVTSCPGCILQLKRQHKNVMHIIELIAEAAEAAGHQHSNFK